MILIKQLILVAIPGMFLMADLVVAQDRLPPIPLESLTVEQATAVAELVEMRGYGPRGPWVPLLRSPEVLTRARAMGDYLRFNSSLPPRLSEFVILMTAREWTQPYEWYAHHQIALDVGVSLEIVSALAEGRPLEGLAEDEAVLYAFFTELNRDKAVSDATYAQALEMFGEKGVIDTVGIIGYYTMLAMTMNTARTPAPGSAEPPLQQLN
jgi:4-carboxymuconolactone decarboxylase